MSIQIKLKNSVVQDSTPSASDLPEVGELAVNGNINSIGGFMRASDNTIVKIFGPGSVTTPTATTTVSGISELATNSETTTGTATNRVVTPAGLNAVTVAERTTSNTNYVAKAGSTLTGVLTMPNGSNSAPAINFGDSDSGIFGGTNTVSLAAGGTTRLTADTGVSVVGTLAVTGAITSTSDLTIPDKIIHSGDTNTAIRFPAADTVSVETSGSERLRADSLGHFIVGSSTARTNFFNSSSNHSPRLQVEAANTNNGRAAIGLIHGASSTLGPYLALGKHRGSVGGNTIVQSADEIGKITFQGNDGTQFVESASIVGFVDGTPGADDMPGRLVFSTTADGAASPTERLRIASNGTTTLTGHLDISSGLDVTGAITGSGDLTIDTNTLHVDSTNNRVGIGTTSPTHMLDISGSNPILALNDTDTTNDRFRISYNGGSTQLQVDPNNVRSGSHLLVSVDGSERIRIDESGRLLAGSTSTANNGRIQGFIAHGTTAGESGITSVDTNSMAAGVGGEIAFYGKTSSSGYNYLGHVRGIKENGTDTNTACALTFHTRPTLTAPQERMRIDSSGRVGIGTTSPIAKLNVNSGTTDLAAQLVSSDANVFLAFKDGDASGNQQVQIGGEGNNLVAYAGGSERMRVDSSGNVGIGTTSPARLLHQHVSSSAANYHSFTNDTTGSGSGNGLLLGINQDEESFVWNYENTNLRFGTNNSERMRIDSSGRVLIGTTTEGYHDADDLTLQSASGYTGITLRAADTAGGAIYFSDATSGNGEYVGQILYSHAI